MMASKMTDSPGPAKQINVVYFDKRGDQRVKGWFEVIVKHPELDIKISTQYHYVASTLDGKKIPAGDVALVFLWPEANMILEDSKLHSGDKRVETVKSLRRKHAVVYIIIYDDFEDSNKEVLYNSRFRQIREHDTLKEFERKGRLISFKDSFKDIQITHIVQDLKTNFQILCSLPDAISQKLSFNIVYFDKHAEENVKGWSQFLMGQLGVGGRSSTKHYLITSTSASDAYKIPRGDVALLFLWPEGTMILEDERHSSDKKVVTANQLIRNHVIVYIIIYDDHEDSDDPENKDAYNRRYRQVKEHETLKKLSEKGRVISFKNCFKAFQIVHMAKDLSNTFQNFGLKAEDDKSADNNTAEAKISDPETDSLVAGDGTVTNEENSMKHNVPDSHRKDAGLKMEDDKSADNSSAESKISFPEEDSFAGGDGFVTNEENSMEHNTDSPGPVKKINVVYFDKRGDQRVKGWFEVIVKHVEPDIKISTQYHYVASKLDGKKIPAGDVALVFLWPEANMILEDSRIHTGDKRVETVKSLRRTHAVVYIIIYDDFEDSNKEVLYNSRFRQIREHDTLKEFERKGRLISFKESFKDSQITHIVQDLKTNLQILCSLPDVISLKLSFNIVYFDKHAEENVKGWSQFLMGQLGVEGRSSSKHYLITSALDAHKIPRGDVALLFLWPEGTMIFGDERHASDKKVVVANYLLRNHGKHHHLKDT